MNLIRVMCIGLIVTTISCTSTSPGIFTKKTAHEKYGQKLKDAGLAETALGLEWFKAAEQSLQKSELISLPYQEAGYFAAEKPSSVSFLFSAKRGEKITASITARSNGTALIYMDLWLSSETKPEFLLSSEEGLTTLNFNPKTNGNYILRIQPELLKNIEYKISIVASPSLAYPLAAPGNNHIKSIFGVDRDGGARRHEGIDMFAPYKTPVLAVAPGVINRVEQTPIGGKVVWLNPDNFNFSIYYAHLDQQLVRPSQRVNIGDTLGLLGSTGNAAGGTPHLHFGIYAPGGAIDPYTFVYRKNQVADKITADTSLLNSEMRTTSKGVKLFESILQKEGIPIQQNSPLKIVAATKDKFRVITPDGKTGYVSQQLMVKMQKPLRRLTLKSQQPILDSISDLALIKKILQQNDVVNILAEHNDYYFIEKDGVEGWIKIN